MRVIEIEYRRYKQESRTASSVSEGIEIKVQVDDGESVQTAIKRARNTARIALGEKPSIEERRAAVELMQSGASELLKSLADEEIFS